MRAGASSRELRGGRCRSAGPVVGRRVSGTLTHPEGPLRIFLGAFSLAGGGEQTKAGQKRSGDDQAAAESGDRQPPVASRSRTERAMGDASTRRPATTSTAPTPKVRRRSRAAPVESRGLIVGGRVRYRWIRLGACRREERPGHACGTKRKLRPATSAGGMGSGGARREPESQDTSVGAAVAEGASGHKSSGRPAGRPWMLRFSDSSGPRPGSRKDFSSNGLQTGPCPRAKRKSPVRLGRGWNPGGNRRRPVAEPVTDAR
jgi:hypothetical protein